MTRYQSYYIPLLNSRDITLFIGCWDATIESNKSSHNLGGPHDRLGLYHENLHLNQELQQVVVYCCPLFKLYLPSL